MESTTQRTGASPFAIWGGAATVVGLASDLLRPLGNFALFLLVMCLAATVTLFFLSRRKPELKSALGFAAIGTLVFGMVALLQAVAPTDESGVKRGFIASTVAPVAAAQSAVLNVPPPVPRAVPATVVQTPTESPAIAAPAVVAAVPASPPVDVWVPPTTQESADFEGALTAALSNADAGNRVRAARFALSSKDQAFQTAVIERLYRAPQPELRQTAIAAIFDARTGRAQFPVLVSGAEGEDAELVNQLQGATLYVSRVDLVTGGVTGSFAGGNPLNGSITRSGISFGTSLSGRGNVTLSLQPTEDFSLKGTLRAQDGKVVQVQLPLM